MGSIARLPAVLGYPKDVPTSNLGWGNDGSVLYIAASTTIYRIRLSTREPASEAPSTPSARRDPRGGRRLRVHPSSRDVEPSIAGPDRAQRKAAPAAQRRKADGNVTRVRNPDILIFGMTQTMTIQVRGRGTLTLPATLRQKYRLGEGDPLTVVDLDGAVLLSPRLLVVPRIAAEMERLRRARKLSLKDLGGPVRED